MKERVSELLTGWVGQYRNSFFLKKLSSLLVIDILVRLSGIILLPVFLWLMTQEEYGLYNYILSIVTTLSVILNFGFYVSQSKYYSDADSAERKKIVLFNISLLLTILLGIVLIPVYAFNLDHSLISILFKNDINYTSYRWLILLAIIISVYSVILTNYFITSEKLNHFRKYNISKLLLVNVAAVIALFLTNSDKINIRLFYTYITELLILVVFLFFYVKEMLPKVDWKIMLNTLTLGLPVMFSAMWGLLSNYSDKFFLEKYGTPKDLSYYYLAFSISNLLYMICSAVQNAWLPTFLKEKDLNKNIINTKKLLTKLTILLLMLSIFLIIGFYFAIKLGIIASKYWPAIYILPILLVAQVFNGILLLYSNYIIYLEKTHWGLFIGMFTSLVGLLGSYFLIPLWNVYGAAIVYLIIQIVYYTVYYVVINHKLKAIILQNNNPAFNATNKEIL